MLREDRLADTFLRLVQIDSVSRDEANICLELQEILKKLGAEIYIDGAGKPSGSNTGNLIARIKGNCPHVAPMLISGHMDTVEPGKKIKPVLDAEGIFRSQGDTILGADDKSALAIIIEVLRVLSEHKPPHGDLEIVFTICEELGLLGARYLEYDQLRSKMGYIFDSSDTESIVTRAPSSNRMEFHVFGKAAHAGAAPEKGINAIFVASCAISKLRLGRIDQETTCNIGIIQGGLATNIVPDHVVIKAEARSHNDQKLSDITNEMVARFHETIAEFQRHSIEPGLPRVEMHVANDFQNLSIPDDHPVVHLASHAAQHLGKRDMKLKTAGGCSDANVFFHNGIVTGVLGTGMQDVHTVKEYIRLQDMVYSAELLLEIINLHQQNAR
ncbi:MAG: M20/M25/M40 family metallo-hydrolase [Desulfobacterales bacterium]|nr:M20/M25/M40 family metallo-hydrolase [Desulfobacterales bacterium]